MKKRSSEQSNSKHKGRLLELRRCLNRVKENTELVQKYGCFWYSHNSFVINVDIFNYHTGCSKRDTTTRYLRLYKFDLKFLGKELKKNIPKNINFDNLPDKKHWSYYKCENFTQDSTEDDIMKMPYYPHLVKYPKDKKDARYQKDQ